MLYVLWLKCNVEWYHILIYIYIYIFFTTFIFCVTYVVFVHYNHKLYLHIWAKRRKDIYIYIYHFRPIYKTPQTSWTNYSRYSSHFRKEPYCSAWMSRHSTQVYPDRKPAQQLRRPSHTGSIPVYPQMTSSPWWILCSTTIPLRLTVSITYRRRVQRSAPTWVWIMRPPTWGLGRRNFSVGHLVIH